MPYIETKEDILFIFLENEEKIEKLYRLYRDRFPAYRDLWRRLEEKEKTHVRILAALKQRFGHKKNLFKITDYSLKIIGYIGDFIDSRLEKTKSGPISASEAIATALRIERSMVEKKCLKTFKPLALDIENIFKKLNRQTDHHIRILAKAFEKSYA